MIQIDAADLQREMARMGKALAKVEGGKQIKREVSKRLRGIVQPAADAMRRSIRALPSKGGHGASMREAVARQTKAATRWGGRNPGASIIQRARGMPRNFNMAGRMFNRDEGWNPTNLDGTVRHQETRPAQWFDSETTVLGREAYAEMVNVLDDLAGTIARDAGSR